MRITINCRHVRNFHLLVLSPFIVQRCQKHEINYILKTIRNWGVFFKKEIWIPNTFIRSFAYLNSLIKYASCSCSLALPITIEHSNKHTCSMFIYRGVGWFIAIMWKSIEKRVTHLIYCSNQTGKIF